MALTPIMVQLLALFVKPVRNALPKRSVVRLVVPVASTVFSVK